LLTELMAVDVTAVNQHGGSRDVAAGYCAALASCFVTADVDEIVAVALRHTRDARHTLEIQAIVGLACDCETCEAFIERYYTEILGLVLPFQDWQHRGSVRPTGRPTSVSWNSLEVLGPVLATFLITRGRDAQAMMLACAKLGRDADTIARVAGGLIGAYLGADAIPKRWVDYVLPRNPWLRLEDKAARLAELTVARLRIRAEVARTYLS
jgi:ADP-ribosylglycohydrolase